MCLHFLYYILRLLCLFSILLVFLCSNCGYVLYSKMAISLRWQTHGNRHHQQPPVAAAVEVERRSKSRMALLCATAAHCVCAKLPRNVPPTFPRVQRRGTRVRENLIMFLLVVMMTLVSLVWDLSACVCVFECMCMLMYVCVCCVCVY